jgi:hypothetical protein
MGAASAGVQSPQSSMPAGKGAGTSPSTPQPLVNPIANNTADSKTITATSNQPSLGQPNTNSNTGMNLAPAGKGGGSSYAAPATPYIPEPESFTNLDASGNPVRNMQVPGQYANTIQTGMTNANNNLQQAASGKGAAAGNSQGKASGGGSTLETMPTIDVSKNPTINTSGSQSIGYYK